MKYSDFAKAKQEYEDLEEYLRDLTKVRQEFKLVEVKAKMISANFSRKRIGQAVMAMRAILVGEIAKVEIERDNVEIIDA